MHGWSASNTNGRYQNTEINNWTYDLSINPNSDDFVFTFSRGLGYGSEMTSLNITAGISSSWLSTAITIFPLPAILRMENKFHLSKFLTRKRRSQWANYGS